MGTTKGTAYLGHTTRYATFSKAIEDVEYATLEWVHWFDTKRLLEPIGYVSPSEFEMRHYSGQQGLAVGPGLN